MSAIEEIKQKTDIVEVIGRYTKLTKAGKTFRGLCPFHSEKHASFFVYPEQQSWHCFGACNTGGDVFSFVMKKEGLEFGEALKLLAERAGVVLPAPAEAEARGKEKDRLCLINQAAARYYHDLLLSSPAAQPTRDYLARRGLNQQSLADFNLGYSPNAWENLKQHLAKTGHTDKELLDTGLIVENEAQKTYDRFRNRLMFPIMDPKGQTIGFGARALDDSLPKYINSPATPVFDKGSTIYGLNLASQSIRQADRAVIVEGYMDVIMAHQYGYKNVIACMGTALGEKHMNVLKRFSRNITLALDPDAAGEEATLRGASLEGYLNTEVAVARLPRGKDPDEIIMADSKAWPLIIKNAVPFMDYAFDRVISVQDISKAQGRAAASEKLFPIIAEIKDPIRQKPYIEKLSRLLKFNQSSLDSALRKIRAEAGKASDAETRARAVRRVLPSTPSSTLEEYCLALLLQHPELKDQPAPLSEYFENSENREIWRQLFEIDNPRLIRERLDPALHEHLAALERKEFPLDQLELRYSGCVLRLRENYLRGLEAKKEAQLTLEAETGGKKAELKKQEEQGIKVSRQLGEVFQQKRPEKRR
jgi:DNA primase